MDTFILSQTTNATTGAKTTSCNCPLNAVPLTTNNVSECGCEGNFTWTPVNTEETAGTC